MKVLIVRADVTACARLSRASAALAVIAATLVASPTAEASTHRETFVTLVGEYHDFITLGKSRYYHSGNSAVSVGGTSQGIGVSTGEGPDGEEFFLSFAPPAGERFKVGRLYTAERYSSPGVASMEIYGGHCCRWRGCSENSGRFLIKDVFFADNGRVARLWLLFEHKCGNDLPMVGEVRYRMPGDGGGLMVAPHAIRWPTLPMGSRQGVAAPVAVRAVNTTSSPLTVSSASIEGSPDMEIRYDECSGRTLVSNESCAVWVRMVPTSPGVHEGSLRITEPSGAIHVTDFRANVVSETESFTPGAGEPGATVGGGSTEFSFLSDPGDYIGQGESRSYNPTNATFLVEYAGHEGINARIFGEDGEDWFVAFVPPLGDILGPGYMYNVSARYTGVTLYVSGDHRGCNTTTGSFAVHSLRIDDFDNPVSLRVTFEQHCEGLGPALRGVFSWQHPGPLPTPKQFTPPPGGDALARQVTIKIDSGRAQGVVKAEEGTACRVGVPVKLQHKVDGHFRTIATLKTDGSARYVKWIGKRYGIYRAVIPRVELSDGTVCSRDVSPTLRY